MLFEYGLIAVLGNIKEEVEVVLCTKKCTVRLVETLENQNFNINDMD